MDIKDILSVGLTAEDFDVLIKGIDAIPGKENADLLNAELLTLMLTPMPTKIHQDQRTQKMEKKIADLKKAQDAQSEDFIVLKSKLILLKRLLLSNAAVSMINEILKNTPPHTT